MAGSKPGERRGGRQKGTPNKRTAAREAEMVKAAAEIESALEKPFSGDAHALLVAIYKDERRPIELRLEAAKAAVRYERPALATVDLSAKMESTVYAVNAEPASEEQWLARHCDEVAH